MTTPTRKPSRDGVRTFLDLSTHHLPKDLAVDLNAVDGVTAHLMPYGWLMWVPDDPAESAAAYEDPDEQFPQEVLTVQLLARELGCDYVMFDADADTRDDLPTWEW